MQINNKFILEKQEFKQNLDFDRLLWYLAPQFETNQATCFVLFAA